ncbi:MAG: glycoside hydrolase family 25 protein [Faecalibacterium sp.]|nr:glycoside hydrolase family 25 protein [Faecalibacterium sp.]
MITAGTAANGQVNGIDVSKYQGTIDWNAVKASGISFVIIRCGYRGYESGAIVEDARFRANIQGARAAGLRVGVYFFSQAINEQEAVEEASACLNLVSGYGLNYPIFFDSEYSTSARTGRADGLSKGDRTAAAVAFCETVRNSGYSAGVYASKNWYANQLNYATVSQYCVWNARYGSAPGLSCNMWQYTSQGTVSGISGRVDLNISYMG